MNTVMYNPTLTVSGVEISSAFKKKRAEIQNKQKCRNKEGDDFHFYKVVALFKFRRSQKQNFHILKNPAIEIRN